MKNMKKKGFTLVELLVVIAIVAILAAVSVVGYTVFINRANISADQQAVTQMNTVLDAAQAGGSLVVEGDDASTSVNIFTALIENEYNDEFVAYYYKYSFGYVVDNNKAYIVLVEDGKVAYPEKYAGKTDYKKFFEAVSDSAQLDEALNTGYVLLKTDSTFSSEMNITNNAVIVGDNKTLTDNVTVNTDTSSNSIIRVAGLDKEVTVRMSGVNLINPDGAYGRAIHVGANSEKVTIIMDNVTIDANHYGFNIAGNNKEVEVIIRNSTLEGYAALQAWSNCNVTLENCTIIGNDLAKDHDKPEEEQELFGAITLYSDEQAQANGIEKGAEGSVLTFKNCTFQMEADANNYYFINSNASATFNFEGCTFKVGENTVTFDEAAHVYKGDGKTVTVNVK